MGFIEPISEPFYVIDLKFKTMIKVIFQISLL